MVSQLNGLVLTNEGEPVAGARIEYYNTTKFNDIETKEPDIMGTTYNEGQYSMMFNTDMMGILYVPAQTINETMMIPSGHAWIKSIERQNYPVANVVVQSKNIKPDQEYDPQDLKQASHDFLHGRINNSKFLEAIAIYFKNLL